MPGDTQLCIIAGSLWRMDYQVAPLGYRIAIFFSHYNNILALQIYPVQLPPSAVSVNYTFFYINGATILSKCKKMAGKQYLTILKSTQKQTDG